MEKMVFDMAIIGAGCAGLQLLSQLSQQPAWSAQRVALFDEGTPQHRSWCFWAQSQHPLQHLVTKSWRKVTFKGAGFSKTEDVFPYQYHYIPGERFFTFFQDVFLPQNPNIEVVREKIIDFKSVSTHFELNDAHNGLWQAQKLFSSVLPDMAALKARFHLKQHFIGWFIKMDRPVFDDTALTLMDFSIPQHADTRFVYVLPFSETEALVEMTVFSPDIYADSVYEEVLMAYMTTHFPEAHFSIKQTERGAIPMTDARFPLKGSYGETLLGTAAGMVKATTGYAFKRISADSAVLAQGKDQRPATQGRFRFYDRLLLGVLTDEPHLGSAVFEALFRTQKMTTIFRFLDEDTSLGEEIGIFCRLPFAPFLKQVYKQWIW